MAPDPNLPVAEQLEFSVRQIKQLLTSLGQMKREVELANKQTLTHEAKIQASQHTQHICGFIQISGFLVGAFRITVTRF